MGGSGLTTLVCRVGRRQVTFLECGKSISKCLLPIGQAGIGQLSVDLDHGRLQLLQVVQASHLQLHQQLVNKQLLLLLNLLPQKCVVANLSRTGSAPAPINQGARLLVHEELNQLQGLQAVPYLKIASFTQNLLLSQFCLQQKKFNSLASTQRAVF